MTHFTTNDPKPYYKNAGTLEEYQLYLREFYDWKWKMGKYAPQKIEIQDNKPVK